MEQDAPFLGDPADLFDRLYGADLIVRMHDRDENRLLGDRPGYILGIDQPLFVRRQIGDRET